MIFHSLTFIVFFGITLLVYWRLPLRAQNVLLLVSSYVFYGWVHPWWPVLLLATTCIDYWSARRIADVDFGVRSRFSTSPSAGDSPRSAARTAWLWVSIVTNFGLLGFYKYFDFFAANVAAAGDAIGWHIPLVALKLALPAGISFYTFQSMSYTIDVYRGHAPARRSFVDVATFVSFFPHLVAGPIMRATNLLPQVERPRQFRVDAARHATVLIVWGLFKKLVIADNVGIIANKVFALQAPEFPVLWAGVFAFAVQIYADFSAYTDIARGVATWYGFDLIKNFRQPYLATGPADFWHRWNISLSTWFRDYVFIPLGGSRRGAGRVAANLMITFLASGFWHGASWNYVLWGAYHGGLLILTRAASSIWSPSPELRRWLRPVQVLLMFGLTCVGWLIFRETEWQQLIADFRLSPWASSELGRSTGQYLFVLVLLYSLPLWICDLWSETISISAERSIWGLAPDSTSRAPNWVQVGGQTALCGVMLALILTLRSQTALNFIYFAF